MAVTLHCSPRSEADTWSHSLVSLFPNSPCFAASRQNNVSLRIPRGKLLTFGRSRSTAQSPASLVFVVVSPASQSWDQISAVQILQLHSVHFPVLTDTDSKMGLPMIQVFMIAARQVSKPIADAVIRYGKDHPGFRNRVLIPIGQRLARMTTRLRMKNIGLGRPETIPPVSEAAALEQASDFVQQVVIFTYSVSVFAGYYAYTKYTAEEAISKEHLDQLKLEYEEKYDELRGEIEKLRAELSEIAKVHVKKASEAQKRAGPSTSSQGGKYAKPFPRVSSLPLDEAATVVVPGFPKRAASV
ncbi:hypothetical protein L596_011074 [Steinernema carpocapsae]|uniref:Uncharacterized protein n=1 Tax=Steinernema carpocapsae TaxID=34508 RepID=A0A4U5NSC9_STECR|nr:hypothetical protein L596_011074 [Steinernema carpocapsae]